MVPVGGPFPVSNRRPFKRRLLGDGNHRRLGAFSVHYRPRILSFPGSQETRYPHEGDHAFRLRPGLRRWGDEPPSARAEFLMAVVGPISSIIVALFFYGLFFLGNKGGLPRPVNGVLSYLASINMLLAVFQPSACLSAGWRSYFAIDSMGNQEKPTVGDAGFFADRVRIRYSVDRIGIHQSFVRELYRWNVDLSHRFVPARGRQGVLPAVADSARPGGRDGAAFYEGKTRSPYLPELHWKSW